MHSGNRVCRAFTREVTSINPTAKQRDPRCLSAYLSAFDPICNAARVFVSVRAIVYVNGSTAAASCPVRGSTSTGTTVSSRFNSDVTALLRLGED